MTEVVCRQGEGLWRWYWCHAVVAFLVTVEVNDAVLVMGLDHYPFDGMPALSCGSVGGDVVPGREDDPRLGDWGAGAAVAFAFVGRCAHSGGAGGGRAGG